VGLLPRTERLEGGHEPSHRGADRALCARFPASGPGPQSLLTPHLLEQRNVNLVGGDLNGGSVRLPQLFLRPTARLYSTSRRDLYICSSSTPPGGGVHGMCGHYAALEALEALH
jgi:hypothetical protein